MPLTIPNALHLTSVVVPVHKWSSCPILTSVRGALFESEEFINQRFAGEPFIHVPPHVIHTRALVFPHNVHYSFSCHSPQKMLT
eukprot:6910051-Ditylum_brightwellii.AAC.1